MRARSASDAVARAKYATTGLSLPRLQADTQALLLRQLYLAHMEQGRYWDARAIAEQIIELGHLGDVALHDASRACLALGDGSAAAGYLRTASRSGPASRRAFHLSCLGSLYMYLEQHADAVRALRRAVRWATSERPLYRAQLALAQAEQGEAAGLEEAYAELHAAPNRSGYTDYVLGELAFRLKRTGAASQLLGSFVRRAEASSVGVRSGLRNELLRAKKLLALVSKSDDS